MRKLLLLLAMLTAPAQARTVTATVYDGWYHNRADACGGTYQHWGVSAAHPWIRCGTLVTVTHRGRSLVVPITDRCDLDFPECLSTAYKEAANCCVYKPLTSHTKHGSAN